MEWTFVLFLVWVTFQIYQYVARLYAPPPGPPGGRVKAVHSEEDWTRLVTCVSAPPSTGAEQKLCVVRSGLFCALRLAPGTVTPLAQRSAPCRRNTGKLVIVDFSATWCPPCRAITPVYEALSEKASFLDAQCSRSCTLSLLLAHARSRTLTQARSHKHARSIPLPTS